jgi:hypothetical protein
LDDRSPTVSPWFEASTQLNSTQLNSDHHHAVQPQQFLHMSGTTKPPLPTNRRSSDVVSSSSSASNPLPSTPVRKSTGADSSAASPPSSGLNKLRSKVKLVTAGLAFSSNRSSRAASRDSSPSRDKSALAEIKPSHAKTPSKSGADSFITSPILKLRKGSISSDISQYGTLRGVNMASINNFVNNQNLNNLGPITSPPQRRNSVLLAKPLQIITSPMQSTFSLPLSAPVKPSAEMESVRVVVRCRPFIKAEAATARRAVITTESTVSINVKGANRDFPFDMVFGEEASQQLVYKACAQPIVEQALLGFNATIFAYGQTGSGKSHTMMGVLNNPELYGIIPNAVEHIFQHIAQHQTAEPQTPQTPSGSNNSVSSGGVQYLLMLSFLEIYNEKVHDLLGAGSKVSLDVREDTSHGFYVPNLSKHIVTERGELLELIEKGNSNRYVSATSQNDVSSRSHSMLILYLEKQMVKNSAEDDGNNDSNTVLLASKLNLVDLAGSERLTSDTKDKQGKETLAINLSLSTLANVINALTEGALHIPYRNSKLTRLLKDSLGGNSFTLMCANINPADTNALETLSTLRYASRAKKIKNKPKVNEDPKDTILRGLYEEISQYKLMLVEKNKMQLRMFHLVRDLHNEVQDSEESGQCSSDMAANSIEKRMNFLRSCLVQSQASYHGNNPHNSAIIVDNHIISEDSSENHALITNDNSTTLNQALTTRELMSPELRSLDYEASERILSDPIAHPLVKPILSQQIPAAQNNSLNEGTEEALTPRIPTAAAHSRSNSELNVSFTSPRSAVSPQLNFYNLFKEDVLKLYEQFSSKRPQLNSENSGLFTSAAEFRRAKSDSSSLSAHNATVNSSSAISPEILAELQEIRATISKLQPNSASPTDSNDFSANNLDFTALRAILEDYQRLQGKYSGAVALSTQLQAQLTSSQHEQQQISVQNSMVLAEEKEKSAAQLAAAQNSIEAQSVSLNNQKKLIEQLQGELAQARSAAEQTRSVATDSSVAVISAQKEIIQRLLLQCTQLKLGLKLQERQFSGVQFSLQDMTMEFEGKIAHLTAELKEAEQRLQCLNAEVGGKTGLSAQQQAELARLQGDLANAVASKFELIRSSAAELRRMKSEINIVRGELTQQEAEQQLSKERQNSPNSKHCSIQ